MRRRLLVAIAVGLILPGSARAAQVLVLNPHGGAVRVDDPYLPALDDPAGEAGRHLSPLARSARGRPKPPPVTVTSTLAALARAHQLSSAAERIYQTEWNDALAAERRMSGTRRDEMTAVTISLHDFAVAGEMTASRLPALFLMLLRNQQWWSNGPLLSNGDRVEFPGSQIVWQYYAGEGLQLQVLGSFGKADGLYTAGPAHFGAMRSLVDEMIPLAATRGGKLAWEYYFPFDGGSPPWTSAMSQATGIEALTRAAKAARAQRDPAAASSYLGEAHAALGILSLPPPQGVSISTPLGRRFLLYSFAPGAAVINGFLQTLVGLFDYASLTGDPTARVLFTAGSAEAQAELPGYDTGAWSLYQPGQEDDLSYHELVTGFLHQLCTRTGARPYCLTAQRFDSYLKTPPALSLETARVAAGSPAQVVFHLSKYSHVGIVLLQGTQTLFATSAMFGYGNQSFDIPAIRHPGDYTVHLAGTDLAGNFNRVIATLKVIARPHRHKGT